MALTSPHLSTQDGDVPSEDLLKMESPSPAFTAPLVEQGGGWSDNRRTDIKFYRYLAV